MHTSSHFVRSQSLDLDALASWTHDCALRAESSSADVRTALQEEIIVAHLWLADSCARRYRGPGSDLEDLQQVARTGLVQAAHRYDPAAGSFVAFAKPTISGVLKRHLRDSTWLVRPPRSAQERAVRMRQEWPIVAQQTRRHPRPDDLAHQLQCSTDEIRVARVADLHFAGESLDTLNGDVGATDPANDRVETRLMVRAACAGLPVEDRQLLYLRFVEERTQADIAKRLHSSQMQVSRRLRKLLNRLHDALGEPEDSDLHHAA